MERRRGGSDCGFFQGPYRRWHHGRAGFLGNSAVFFFLLHYLYSIFLAQFEKLSSKVSAIAQAPDAGDSHKTTHVLLLDACSTRKRVIDLKIVDLVKNTLAFSQTIFKVSNRTAQGIANAVGALTEIFQLAYSTQFVTRCMARVHISPYSYVQQLRLTRNYKLIPKEKREMMESQSTFDTLIGGVLESNQVLEEVFEDLRWPKNEERRSDPVDMRTINQQRALIMNSKAKLDALSARLATHRAEVKKQKAEEKKEAKRQDKVLAEATKAQAAVPVLQDENKQLKKDSQKFQKQALKAQGKLKQGAKKAKEAERENASLKKQLAALQASQASLSSASSSSIRLPEPTDDGDGDVDWQPSVQTTSSGRRSKPPPSRGG